MFGFTDIPGQPSKPELSDLTDTSLTLTWVAPTFDGGAPITSFTVEYKNKEGAKWIPLKTGKPVLSYTVQGLQTGADYIFRVSACNKVR